MPQFRRVNPVPYKQVYTILDGVEGKGQYVGTYLAWGVHNDGWWGEGEIKFYLDGDTKFPTINGTGTEDYFNGSYNFENQVDPPIRALYLALLGPGAGDQARWVIPVRSSGSAYTGGIFLIPSVSIMTCA